MKHTLTLALILFTTPLILFAQIKLPEVPKVSEGKAKIEGTYIPRDDFKKSNPGFEKDGTYYYDYSYAIVHPVAYKNTLTYILGHRQFSNMDFPANEQKSDNSLAGFGKILVQLTTDIDDYKSRFNLGDDWRDGMIKARKSRTDIYGYAGVRPSSRDVNEQYDELNKSYLQSAKEVLQKKIADSIGLCNAGTLEFENVSNTSTNLVFQFVYIQTFINEFSKQSQRFPSFGLYKLIVKNIYGAIYKSYSQAIFFEGKDAPLKTPRILVLKITLPVAMENLINRFLEDNKTVQKVLAEINEEKYIRKTYSQKDSLYTYKRSYERIRSKKQQLLFDLIDLEGDFASVDVKFAFNNEAAINNAYNQVTATTSNPYLGLLAGSLAGSGGPSVKDVKKQLEQYKKKLYILQQTASGINKEEQLFLDSLSMIFDDPFDIGFVTGAKANDDATLNNYFSKLSNNKNELFESYQQQSDIRKKEQSDAFASNFSSSLNSLISSLYGTSNSGLSGIATTTTPTAETMATTNGGNNMDACQQKAMSEYYKSSEYKNWQTRKLQSDAYDAQAKMCDLTLQYCSDKLPPSDIAKIKKARDDARKVADQLRAANQFNYKP